MYLIYIVLIFTFATATNSYIIEWTNTPWNVLACISFSLGSTLLSKSVSVTFPSDGPRSSSSMMLYAFYFKLLFPPSEFSLLTTFLHRTNVVRLTVSTIGSTCTRADAATSRPRRSHGWPCAPSWARRSTEVAWTTSSTCVCSRPSSSSSSRPTVSTATSRSRACPQPPRPRSRSSCACPREPRARTSSRGSRRCPKNRPPRGSDFPITRRSWFLPTRVLLYLFLFLCSILILIFLKR